MKIKKIIATVALILIVSFASIAICSHAYTSDDKHITQCDRSDKDPESSKNQNPPTS